MSDRELLELAAKANGWNAFEGQANQMIESGWNPLSDDGDAFRLAVRLGMVLDTDYNGGSIAGNCKVECNYDEPEFGYQEGIGKKDPYAATRRAIVRAAAEIGRTMP